MRRSSRSTKRTSTRAIDTRIKKKPRHLTFAERIAAGNNMSQHIKHCLKSSSFYIVLNGKKSVLDYRQLPNKVLDFYHTEVPVEHRGQGYAAQLVKEGFKFAKTENFKVIPSCSYVAKYAREMATPEEKNLVINE
uniref:Protein NATD1 n=1 Tax=Panagrellus redivivus TaxID=6233 RepID=A0A7E4UVJ5_PANRE